MPELYTDPFLNSMRWSRKQDESFLIGDPDGEPYVVQYSAQSWMAVNVVIFAQDEADAIRRVENGIRKLIESDDSTVNRIRGEKILAIEPTVEKFDKRYVSKAIWACNDSIL